MSISNGQVITDGTASFIVCAKADNNRLCLPADNRVSLNLTSSGQTFTAPSDGWIFAYDPSSGSSNRYVNIIVGSDNYTVGTDSYATGASIRFIAPVRKSASFKITYGNNGSTLKLYFIPALNVTVN